MTVPSIFELLPLLYDENACISFLLQKQLFYTSATCPEYGSDMKLHLNDEKFKCRRKACRKAHSIRIHSFFAGTKLPCSKILFIGYLWLTKTPVTSATTISGHCSNTICNFYRFFLKLVSYSVEIEYAVIGGEGIVVEIDESKLGKRKNHREHHVEGVWVVGGVERTPERKTFIVSVENRSANTLIDIISRHLRLGSIIYTDMWAGYGRLSENTEFQHMTVNHSLYLRDPLTGVHTNTIEGTWNGVKQHIKPANRVADEREEHFWEFIWRRKNKNNLWESLLDALQNIYYE
jgi:hypothetical protein